MDEVNGWEDGTGQDKTETLFSGAGSQRGRLKFHVDSRNKLWNMRQLKFHVDLSRPQPVKQVWQVVYSVHPLPRCQTLLMEMTLICMRIKCSVFSGPIKIKLHIVVSRNIPPFELSSLQWNRRSQVFRPLHTTRSYTYTSTDTDRKSNYLRAIIIRNKVFANFTLWIILFYRENQRHKGISLHNMTMQ